MINYFWFVLAAFCEIAGCYAFYLWLRLGKSALWVLPGLLSLTLFALLLTRVEASYAGRAYAAYGASTSPRRCSGWLSSSARGRYGATGWAWPCAWSVPASCCSARACLSDSGGVGGAPVTGAGPRRPGPPHPEPADHCEVLRCTSPFS